MRYKETRVPSPRIRSTSRSARLHYKAACNVFLMDPRRLVSRSKVPIMQGAITRMRAHYFNKPSPIPVDVLFGVPDPSTVEQDMTAGKCEAVAG